MNAVEIEEAVTELAEKPFGATELPYQFLAAFGNKDTTIKRLRSGSTNASDLPGGVLQRSYIHIAVANPGAVAQTLAAFSSENRPCLPVGLLGADAIIQDQAFARYDAPLWNMALIASRLHLVWIGTVCGKLKTDYRYSNTLGWNTFPVPTLTEKNKTDLSRCAEDILLAREAHFPATIADLYDPDHMPADLREAHKLNDEILECIYIGRRFRNDTERLEKLFKLYTRMTASAATKPARQAKA
jgi:hypothetical protein